MPGPYPVDRPPAAGLDTPFSSRLGLPTPVDDGEGEGKRRRRRRRSPERTFQERLITGAATAFALATAAGLAIRLQIAPLAAPVVVVTVVFLGIFAVVPWLVRRGRAQLGGALTVAGMAALLAAVAYAVGGLDTPALVVLPVVPLGAVLLLGVRAGWVTTLAVLGVLAGLVVLHGVGHDFPPSLLDSAGSRIARAVFIGLSSVLVAAVAWVYDSQLRRLMNELRHQAIHDDMTGLANRRRIEQSLEIEMRRSRRTGEPLTVLLLDVDRFKELNDTHGHLAGDRCLVAVATIAGRRLRRASDLVGRYGGDEFAAVLPGTPHEEGLALAESIRREVERLRLPSLGGPDHRVSVSVGVATREGPDEDRVDRLIAAADRALYRAKLDGRNRVAGDVSAA